MAKPALQTIPWHDGYRVADLEPVLTPALVIYPDLVDTNIEATLRLLDGDPERWRPHVKTTKLARFMRRLVEYGIRNLKCATTLELRTACQAGARDVLIAYPARGANAERVKELAREFSNVRISALVEHESQIAAWRGSALGLFVDINPGMNRTGVEQERPQEVLRLARAIRAAGLEFRGLHYYEGHLGGLDLEARTRAAHQGYDQLMEAVATVERAGVPVEEVITAGTPTFPCSLSYAAFRCGSFVHRVSPGTVVYCDATSLAQLPDSYGYRAAALVIARVVSHPYAGVITCDAGHKSVSADAGVPTCVVVGRPDLKPLSPSEEHLPMAVEASASPALGDALYLVPRHVCPTVNNFDHALIVENGVAIAVEPVSARGREAPVGSVVMGRR